MKTALPILLITLCLVTVGLIAFIIISSSPHTKMKQKTNQPSPTKTNSSWQVFKKDFGSLHVLLTYPPNWYKGRDVAEKSPSEETDEFKEDITVDLSNYPFTAQSYNVDSKDKNDYALLTFEAMIPWSIQSDKAKLYNFVNSLSVLESKIYHADRLMREPDTIGRDGTIQRFVSTSGLLDQQGNPTEYSLNAIFKKDNVFYVFNLSSKSKEVLDASRDIFENILKQFETQ